jgi:hypothetical protein
LKFEIKNKNYIDIGSDCSISRYLNIYIYVCIYIHFFI